MNWLILAILAYFILALVNIADKFLLDKVLPSSRAYTFLVGAIGIFVFVFSPWFLEWPGIKMFFVNFVVGALFPAALLLFYKSLKESEASKALVLIGGLVPFFTLLFSVFFLGDKFSLYQWLAFGFLLIGIFIISWMPEKQTFLNKVFISLKIKKKPSKLSLLTAVGAAFLFALFFVGNKYAFNNQDFFSAFIWIRGGSFLFVLSMLIPKESREKIIKNIKNVKLKKGGLFFMNQGLSAVGFFLQNLAISLTSVALVSALQGVQYVFIIILGVLFTLFYPKIIKEDISKKIIIQKTISVIFIAAGLYLLTV
jgi:drug/metabolite transporter (DMT)-like permease